MNTNGKVSFGADGQGEGMFNVHDIAYFYNTTRFNGEVYLEALPANTTSSTNYIRAGSSGRLFRGESSSKRYKNHVDYMDSKESEKLYDIPVALFEFKDGYLEESDCRYRKTVPGFYAEDMEECIQIATDYVEIDGKTVPENWNVRFLIPYMVKCIQEQHKEIEQLKATINNIKQALASAGIEV